MKPAGSEGTGLMESGPVLTDRISNWAG